MRKNQNQISKSNNLVLRWFWLIIGLLLTGLGLIGIFIPGLPTTIFMILAASCYFRSSQRLYSWVMNHKYFGYHVKNYRDKKGMPLKAKIMSLIMMWLFVLYAVTLAISVDLLYIKAIVIISALFGTKTILSLKSI